MHETDDMAQAETRSIDLVCEVWEKDMPEGEREGVVIRTTLPLNHQDVAETKFENFIGELAEVLGEYFEEPEQEQSNTIYPH